MEKLLQAFKMADIQTALNIYELLEINNKSFKDVRKYLKKKRRERKKFQQKLDRARRWLKKKWKKCPECNGFMTLYPVNQTTEDQVGGGYKSQWLCGKICNNTGCGYEEFSRESVQRQLEKYKLWRKDDGARRYRNVSTERKSVQNARSIRSNAPCGGCKDR